MRSITMACEGLLKISYRPRLTFRIVQILRKPFERGGESELPLPGLTGERADSGSV